MEINKTNFENFFQSINYPALILDSSLNIVAANSAIKKIIGLQDDEIIGNPYHKLIQISDTDKVLFCRQIDKIVKEGINGTLEMEMETLGRNYLVSCTPIFDENNKLDKIIQIAIDITKQKNMQKALEVSEKALKKSEKNFRELVDNSLVGIFQTNLKGSVLFINEAMVDMYHYNSIEELKEGNIIKLYKTEKERTQFINKLRKERHITGYEIETVAKDGQTVNVLVSASLEEDVLSGMFMDITERKKSERLLINSEKRYRTLYSSMNEGVAIHNLIYENNIPVNYKIIDINQSYTEILGFNRVDIVGKKATEIYGTKKAPYLKIFSDVAQKGSSTQFETYFEPMDKYFSINVFSPSKGIFATVFEDISNRKKDEYHIKRSLEEKGLLLREIHHRVKNNMQIISSLLNLQIQHVAEEESVNVLKESQGRVKSLAMVHEKLYQSSGFTKIDFKDYIEKLVYDILYSYGIKQGTIETDLDIEEITMNMETAIPCGLIINELVTNSVKYAFPKGKGRIKIQLRSFNQELELIIADNGIGIPENIDLETSDTLGLQLVKNLINQLEGTLKLNLTSGTEFKIKFKELNYKRRI